MKIVIAFILLLSWQQSYALQCTKEKAFEIGMKEIEKKFSNYKKSEPYQIKENKSGWEIYGTMSKGWRGGTPVAIVEKVTCKVTEINGGR